MPPLPVIAGCYRVTWNFQTSHGITPRIVQHFGSPSNTVDVFGASFVISTVDNMFNPMPQSFEPLTIDVLPLDGVTPTQTFDLPTGGDLCQAGEECSPASAAIMSCQTGQRGPRGRGRSFIGPVAEAEIANGLLDSTDVDAMEDAWTEFVDNLEALSPQIFHVVASYTHEDMNPVTNRVFESVLGTQRRRQNQLR